MGESAKEKVIALLEQLEQRDAAGDAAGSVAICEELLKYLKRDALPEMWATIQGTLADNLRHLPGDDARERAIHHYRCALEVLSEKEHAVQWAANNGNVGNLYLDRKKGVRSENLKQAITHRSA